MVVISGGREVVAGGAVLTVSVGMEGDMLFIDVDVVPVVPVSVLGVFVIAAIAVVVEICVVLLSPVVIFGVVGAAPVVVVALRVVISVNQEYEVNALKQFFVIFHSVLIIEFIRLYFYVCATIAYVLTAIMLVLPFAFFNISFSFI